MPSPLVEYSTHARENEMKEGSNSARHGCILVLMASALVGTFFLAVINWTIAPMDASWLLIAAKECAHSVLLPFVGRTNLASLGKDGMRP